MGTKGDKGQKLCQSCALFNPCIIYECDRSNVWVNFITLAYIPTCDTEIFLVGVGCVDIRIPEVKKKKKKRYDRSKI